MLRGGAVCVQGPVAAEDSLPRVSPRIRALQDRLLDSLPADGAWECLSPAQREAIISLHRARLTRTLGVEEPERGKRYNRKTAAKSPKAQTKGLNRYSRSRSYEDKLESETDDSGVRVASGVGGGTNSSSASNSQNSHEDDSSDPGVKRGGNRFAKSSSVDRLAVNKDGTSKTAANSLDPFQSPKKKGLVTNGIGNVNKIISKQLNNHRSGPAPSNITLDCRNFQGDRRRARVDKDIFDTRQLHQQQQHNANLRRYHARGSAREGISKPPEPISRKNILQKYQDPSPSPTSIKKHKESTSSEEYDSGVNVRIDGTAEVNGECAFIQPLKSHQRADNEPSEYNLDFEYDPMRRNDATNPSPRSLNRKEGMRVDRYFFPKEQIRLRNPTGPEASLESGIEKEVHQWDGETRVAAQSRFLKQTKGKMVARSYEDRFNPDLDYRTHLNQDAMLNKYSSNWNSIILRKDTSNNTHNIPAAKSHLRNVNSPLYRTSAAPHGRSVGNLLMTSPNQSGFTGKPDEDHLVDEPQSWGGEYPVEGKKFVRSKSLDRKYMEEEDSSDDESEFETPRKKERTRRHAKATGFEWEARVRQMPPVEGIDHHEVLKSNPFPEFHSGWQDGPRSARPKARSAWDISVGGKPLSSDVEDHDERNNANGDNCFRSRRTILNRWKSEESELASHYPTDVLQHRPNHNTNAFVKRRKELQNQDLTRSRWRRLSCDFELETSDNDLEGPETPAEGGFATRQWQRRSCDFEFELRNNDDFEDTSGPLDQNCFWNRSLEADMRRFQRRHRLHATPRGPEAELGRRRYSNQGSPGRDEPKKKRTEARFLQEELTVTETCREEEGVVSLPAVVGAMEDHPTHYQIQPEISGRKWARVEDLQNCQEPNFASNHKRHQAKGKNGKSNHGFRGKLRFFKSILSF